MAPTERTETMAESSRTSVVESNDIICNENMTEPQMVPNQVKAPGRTTNIRRQLQSITPECNEIPGWVIAWFIFTAVICTWDASFIMLRPLSFPNGRLSHLWYPYKYYINLDKRYGNMADSYVFSQSLMNYAEVILNLWTCYLNKLRSNHTIPMAFTVSIMTFWKTVLYLLMFVELGGDTTYRDGNSVFGEIFCVFIPNGIWLVIPMFVMGTLWKNISLRYYRDFIRRNDQYSINQQANLHQD
ncbi:uncharacterized protein LOC115229444 [Argonauta hians]